MASEQQMVVWIGDLAEAPVTLDRYARASYRATWEKDGQRHVFTFGQSLRELEQAAFKARAAELIAEGQHSYFTTAL